MAPEEEEEGYRTGRLFGLTLCGCSYVSHILCNSRMWEDRNVNVRKGKHCWIWRCHKPVPLHTSARQQKGSVPHICQTVCKVLPGWPMPERNTKERFCHLCRKIDDSENERFSMGCNWTEQISLASPTFYCYFSLLLQQCLETWASQYSKLEILMRRLSLSEKCYTISKRWRQQEEKTFSTQKTLLVLDPFWQTDAGRAGATSQHNQSQKQLQLQ